MGASVMIRDIRVARQAFARAVETMRQKGGDAKYLQDLTEEWWGYNVTFKTVLKEFCRRELEIATDSSEELKK